MADMIDRQAAIENVCDEVCRYFDAPPNLGYKIAEKAIEQLPTVEERTGHWIEMGQNEDGTHNLCCGVCGKFKFKSKGHANSYYTKNKYKFCGGCGARMTKEGTT